MGGAGNAGYKCTRSEGEGVPGWRGSGQWVKGTYRYIHGWGWYVGLVCFCRGVDSGVEALERAGKMQGMNIPFPTGTNVPAGTNVPFPTGTFVPVKKTFLSMTLKN